MEIPKEVIEQLTQTSKCQTQKVSSDAVASSLERFGWLRSIAGDDDFNKAVKAVVMSIENNRGILLTGDVGVGKTALLDAIFKFRSCRERAYLRCKDEECLCWMRDCKNIYYQRNVFLDDLGSESIKKEYGNAVDVVGDFIMDYHSRGEGKLFITTNFDSNKLNDVYGGRVLDRLLEMCVVCKFSGKSKRERMIVK